MLLCTGGGYLILHDVLSEHSECFEECALVNASSSGCVISWCRDARSVEWIFLKVFWNKRGNKCSVLYMRDWQGGDRVFLSVRWSEQLSLAAQRTQTSNRCWWMLQEQESTSQHPLFPWQTSDWECTHFLVSLIYCSAEKSRHQTVCSSLHAINTYWLPPATQAQRGQEIFLEMCCFQVTM